MNTNFKTRSFKYIFWIMILLLVVDSLDTIYRFVIIGYLGEGTTFPGVDNIIKPTTADLIIFTIIQIGIIYGIYLLYNLKRVGGYWFIVSQIMFLIYASILGPIAEIGISNILMPIILFFILYIILTIFIPWFYSDKFE